MVRMLGFGMIKMLGVWHDKDGWGFCMLRILGVWLDQDAGFSMIKMRGGLA